ncbi:d260d624-fbca-4a34-b51e-9cf57d387a31 [Sclerotinia trifoliorum]|uniref:D260d624-fbca-4a34-b51e-9cf57d387a31 n=1 Tax=Sclerotinia trifoliorum TaxID=28548 RepID=A0A8H2VPB8_9HELO|nr:d260d624-fbca-4a34-b51e-9cf57d387a31 [Sclerotinia trifoliorum]
MAAPYWGQLPPPKVSRQGSIGSSADPNSRKSSLSVDTKMDRLSSQDPRRIRESTQTEAPTISTQSPFTSPVASTFRGDGLAPRPPSFPYNTSSTSYDNDYLEKRRKREESRNKDNLYEFNPAVSPPTVADISRAHPSGSYREPVASGALFTDQAPARSRAARKSDGADTIKSQETNWEVLGTSSPISERDSLQRSGTAGRGDGKGSSRRGGHTPTKDPPRRSQTAVSETRRPSYSEATEVQRRKEWASDRSPLQRLELTLDSITKEEKRARVEEAERLIKEKGGKSTRPIEQPAQNTVRFRNRPVAKAPEGGLLPERRLVTESLPRTSSIKSKESLSRSGSVLERIPITHASQPIGLISQERSPIVSRETESSSIPKRTSSKKQKSGSLTAGGAVAAAEAANSLYRSKSNKLRKDPPLDHWSRHQSETEMHPEDDVLPSLTSGRQVPSAPSRRATAPTASRNLPARGPELRDESSYDSEDDMKALPFRRGSKRKMEQVTGQNQSLKHSSSAKYHREAIPASSRDAGPPIAGDGSIDHEEHHHRFGEMFHHHHNYEPGNGLYAPPQRLKEWKKGEKALLAGNLLDLEEEASENENGPKPAWREAGLGRKRSVRQKKAEAYDGEYDDNNAPTRFKPPLLLKCGPLLRYYGIRTEKTSSRSVARGPLPEREVWRGSVMIVTQDSSSSYELAPTLRLFLQPVDLLPPPPAQVDGEELAPEYIDPIAGLTKIGRDGRTLYTRPVEQLPEGKDLSQIETNEGLFESRRSHLDGNTDPKRRRRRDQYDGEKAGKFKEVRGFRLHADKGFTFWRFNIEVELRSKQQRIAYRINRGPATGFWVPARGQSMNIMFHSCNGFTMDVHPNDFSGPDPLWRDVLNTHQTQPFHVMLGGGDQLYNDHMMERTTLFKEWLNIKNPLRKEALPFTPEMQDEMEHFYLDSYCMWFSQGLFGVANSQIPMINIFDDHDIIDGFGSYPDTYMKCPVMSGLGSVAFKYYMLFQQQSSIDEGEETEPSWILGAQPGPYISELSRSIFTGLGRGISFLGIDCRTERMNDEIVTAETYTKIFDRLERDIIKGQTKHLIVLLGVPIAYPRMVWLETLLTSKVMTPLKAMGRAGLLGKSLMNHFDGGVEILDDLDDHWTAAHHKEERNWLIQELQDLAAEKSVRISILGGDVHLGAIGQFYSNPKLKIPKDQDYRYMTNIISSAIVNAPPPDMLADILNKRNKVHHFDADTDEDMIPIFTHDVDGKPRNNKRLLNRRNWCSIREYNPSLTRSNSPDATTSYDGSISPPRRGLLRRFTTKGPSYRPDAPPLSNASFFNRRPSLSRPSLSLSRQNSTESARPGSLKRTLSLTRKDFTGLFRRSSKRRDSGGINGYGSESEDDLSHNPNLDGPTTIRGGAGDEYYAFENELPRAATYSEKQAATSIAGSQPQAPVFTQDRFHRTPTGLSERQIRKGNYQNVNLEGGLDICLNVEVNQKDPAGITMPYRLLVPALWYEDDMGDEAAKRKREYDLVLWLKKRTASKGQKVDSGKRLGTVGNEEMRGLNG